MLLLCSKKKEKVKSYEARVAEHRLSVLGPFVLAADLLLLLGREVVGDVESLSNLLRRLALDHVGHSLAADIQEGLDVKEVGCLGLRLVGSQTPSLHIMGNIRG